jgi:hypothetical protein
MLREGVRGKQRALVIIRNSCGSLPIDGPVSSGRFATNCRLVIAAAFVASLEILVEDRDLGRLRRVGERGIKVAKWGE